MPLSFGFGRSSTFKKKGGISSPTEVTNLKAWYKADGVGPLKSGNFTAASADGDLLTGWQDSSGNGIHLGLGYSSANPIFKTGANGLNGLPGVYLNGNACFYGYSALFTDALTAFAVVKYDSAATRGWVLDATNGGFPYHLAIEQNNNKTGLFVGANGYSSTTASTTNAQIISFAMGPIVSNQNVASNTMYRVNKTTSALTAYSSNNPIGAFPDYTGRTGNFWLGSAASKVLPMTGMVYEYIFYNRKLSETEMLDVENYLSSKWGI